jgi:transposase
VEGKAARRNTVAQRGHNKQGRHNLRQVGLSYVLDGESGLSLCHHVYPGNVADAEEFPVALERIQRLLARHAIPSETVTLVFDKGTAALANTVLLKEAGLGWISALPWNQAPAEFRQRPVEALPACSSAQPGMQAAAEKLLVHGEEYLCVLKYSATFAAEQLHSLSASLSKALGALKRLAVEMARPGNRLTPVGIEAKIHRWLSAPFLSELVHYQILDEPGGRRLVFQVDHAALQKLLMHRLGRTLVITNRLAWTAEQVVAAYAGQQAIEQVFRGLKEGDWLNWQPLYHWTDSKIRVHAFTACWVSPCCTMFAAKPRPSGPRLPSKNCRTSWSRSNSLYSCILPRARVLIAPPPWSPPRASSKKAWSIPWACNNSVVPHVGNTNRSC